MKTDFEKYSVAYGLQENEFDALDDKVKTKLLTLMSRISESSYRRGFQHGKLNQKTINPSKLRFEISLDKAPFTANMKGRQWIDSGHKSIDRLDIEHGMVLSEIGFEFE